MSTAVKFTYDQYQEMIRLGLFDPPEDHRVELIFGKIVPIDPGEPDEPDQSAARRLRRRVDRVEFRGPAPRRGPGPGPGIDRHPRVGEPAPTRLRLDVARGDIPKVRPAPEDILLLVEVSDTSTLPRIGA